MKARPDPTPTQGNQTAELSMSTLGGGTPWKFSAKARPNESSKGFKTRELAVKAALEAGFVAVQFEGKTIARS